MSTRTAAGAAAAVVAGAAALRALGARRTARALTGDPSGLLTDDGVRLHVEAEGPPGAPLTVVLAHGFAARSAMFAPQWAGLRGRARLVGYDQRGHGASGWSGFRSATPERLGRDLGLVVDALGGTGRVVLVGHSMGGMAVPVLVLAGTEDATFPAAAAERLAGRIGPAARLVLVPGARHMVTRTRAGAVDAALAELLDRATAGDRRTS